VVCFSNLAFDLGPRKFEMHASKLKSANRAK